ncbi:MAG: hypothetical protein HC886_23545 [Leptolyngbyaceae cyanobacterium SM1_1_3]|nr:hypothetical protein [Leptolyngbyaceae cyanobacterium SM1_1_3]
MGPTNLAKTQGQPGQNLAYLATISLMVLPFINLAGLVGFVLLLGLGLCYRGQAVVKWLWRRGFVALAIALAISTFFAGDRAEALLQLTNFLPYFLLLGVLAVWLPTLRNPFAQLEEWASWLTITTLPINLLAIAEYVLMAPAMAQRLQQPVLAWLYRLSLDQDFGHRANAIFDHPNTLACYLTLILGLNLGLIFSQSLQTPSERSVGVWPYLSQYLWPRPVWLYLSAGLILVGIFCSGSRNGLLVAIIEVLIVIACGQRQRL